MNWERVRLGEVCNMKSGGTPSRKKSSFFGGNIKWCKISDIENATEGIVYDTEEKITEEGLSDINGRIFSEGTLLLAMYGSVGKVAFINEQMSVNQAILGINIKNLDILDSKFLYYWFIGERRNLVNKAVGVTLKNISKGIVESLTIPLPPMSVQKEIVEKLDKAAAIREKSKALLAHYDALAESLFIELFGDPISNEKGWEKKKLGEVIMLNPKKAEISDIDKTKKGSFLEMANVLEDGSIILCDDRRIDEMWKGYTYFAENDVLFAKITPCMENGKGAVVKGLTNGIGFGSTEFHVLRPKAGISDSYWIYGIIKNNKFRNKAKQNMKGSAGQKRVPTEFLNGFEIPLPPLSLQIKFAEMVENIEEQKARAKAEIEKGEAVFQALLQESFG